MNISFKSRNHKIGQEFEEYVNSKVGKITQLGVTQEARLDVKVTEEEHAKVSDSALKVELTVLSKGPAIRAEATGAKDKETFDIAFNKLIERLRRAHDKKKHIARKGHHRKASTADVTALPESTGITYSENVDGGVVPDPIERIFEDGQAQEFTEDEAYNSPVVIRKKAFPASDMKVEDAVDNMELLGHDFYLFKEQETGQPQVVYRRKGWDYGVIVLDENIEEETEEVVLDYKP